MLYIFSLSDEFNRVIIPVKRGEENTDYVNASFIDVSIYHNHTPSVAFNANKILDFCLNGDLFGRLRL